MTRGHIPGWLLYWIIHGGHDYLVPTRLAQLGVGSEGFNLTAFHTSLNYDIETR